MRQTCPTACSGEAPADVVPSPDDVGNALFQLVIGIAGPLVYRGRAETPQVVRHTTTDRRRGRLMNAAIYARKSTSQEGVADEQKSVTRQIDLARAFAAGKGWTVSPEHVYVDDGISGAEFANRPGLQQLLRACLPIPGGSALHASTPSASRHVFRVLVVAEQKALGREAFETQYLIKQLAEAGVEVWGYMDARSLTPRNWLDKAMSSMRAAADEAHREDTARRTHEAHKRLAEQGHVCGGRVFGYRNVDVVVGVDPHGRPLRSHVERVVIPEERDVIVRIFQDFAAGYGLKAIAKSLTREHAPKPAPPARHDGSDPSRLGSVHRTHHPGTTPVSRTRGVESLQEARRLGQGKQHSRNATEHVVAVREDLRIVPEDLWVRVASRRADTAGKAVRFDSGRLSGRPRSRRSRTCSRGWRPAGCAVAV